MADKGQASCPKDWALFEPAKDKFILGAGGSIANVRNTGGAPSIDLRAEHLPVHSHAAPNGLTYLWVTRGSAKGNLRWSFDFLSDSENQEGWMHHKDGAKSGAGGQTNPKEVETMPPYVALYYCIKN